jgi:hypothetical protein
MREDLDRGDVPVFPAGLGTHAADAPVFVGVRFFGDASHARRAS